MAAPQPESNFMNCQYCNKVFRARGIKSHKRRCPECTHVVNTSTGNTDPTIVHSLQTLINNDHCSGMLYRLSTLTTGLNLTLHNCVDAETWAILTARGIRTPTDMTMPPLQGIIDHSHKNKFHAYYAILRSPW